MLDATDATRDRHRFETVPMFPLEATGLTLADRGRTLVDGVTLRLERGPRTVVMGPNGAGKSLLLRMLHGIVQPSSGAVTWAGDVASEAVRAKQAMVFQRPTLLRRSVEANIRFVLKGLDASEARERTAQILSRSRLQHLAQAPARLLSGGEQQRLALARALALDPAILFLDEPCASLDPASTQAVEELIETAHAEGTKIVLVTHDIGQARRLADEVIFVHHGRLIEQAPAARFFAAPSTTAARAYLGGLIPL
jgi:tungstate transport system ATP-binding protein